MFLQTRCKIDSSGKCTFEKEWILTILVYVCYIASHILPNPTPSPNRTILEILYTPPPQITITKRLQLQNNLRTTQTTLNTKSKISTTA